MDLKHYEFITSCSSFVGVHGHIFKAIATNFLVGWLNKIPFDEQCPSNQKICSYGLENTSMDPNEAATACYELIML